ncbi:Pyridoxamine 5'-phosphate oxidase [Flavobacteriaceae bacterium MAR_2010_188]|nr:Pyridoxamine 5'-phosphate oxidase [Flavobacteriaceae bacterium MAR_2010_188]
MKKDLSNYRKSYEKSELTKATMDKNPIEAFRKWFDEVDGSDSKSEANAMTLSTFGIDGFPRNRVVLLKEFNEEGFVFYTNYGSQKGKAIEQNNHVCISFFWSEAERQVIIKGTVKKVPESQSEEYFHSRPKGSQLGAAVSNQSEVIESRDILETKLHQLEDEYSDKTVPKPKDWGGYIISPIEFEFWQGRANRLHDRIRYSLKDAQNWKMDRLAP